MNELDIELKTIRWTNETAGKLLDEYKSCKTEKSKIKVLEKLKSFKGRVEYEHSRLEKIINGMDENETEF